MNRDGTSAKSLSAKRAGTVPFPFGNVLDIDKVETLEVLKVVGNWNTGTNQKDVWDALATYGQFDGVVSQNGAAGTITGMQAANHPIVQMGVDGENDNRMLRSDQKIPCISTGQVGNRARSRGCRGSRGMNCHKRCICRSRR